MSEITQLTDRQYSDMSKDRDDLSNMIDKLELIDQIDTHFF